jgi:MFS transporter, DHA2 family, multidrug resistance protein
MVALTCLLYSIDLTVLELAMQKLSLHLRSSSSQLLWIMDICGFLLAGFLITMGTSGDRIGCKRLLLIGLPPSEPPRYSLLSPASRKC